MKNIVLFCYLLFALSSCANFKRVHRVEVVVDSHGDLYYSNLETDPYDGAERDEGLFKYKYYIVFQNKAESKAYTIHLDRSKIELGDSTESLHCEDEVSGEKKTLLVQPMKTYKVRCDISLSANQNPAVLHSDQTANLIIRVERSKLWFPLKLKIEDFE